MPLVHLAASSQQPSTCFLLVQSHSTRLLPHCKGQQGEKHGSLCQILSLQSSWGTSCHVLTFIRAVTSRRSWALHWNSQAVTEGNQKGDFSLFFGFNSLEVLLFKFNENRQKRNFQVGDAAFNDASWLELKKSLQTGDYKWPGCMLPMRRTFPRRWLFCCG